MTQAQTKALRNEIGMLFQGSALFDSETVLGNVMFPLRMFTHDSYAACKKRAEFCLERVNLKGVNDLYPSEISGGMQKRVAIARAIALNPKYLFATNLNSGLDPKTSILIDELLRRHHPRVQHDNHHQHSRHEFGNRHRREYCLHQQGVPANG